MRFDYAWGLKKHGLTGVFILVFLSRASELSFLYCFCCFVVWVVRGPQPCWCMSLWSLEMLSLSEVIFKVDGKNCRVLNPRRQQTWFRFSGSLKSSRGVPATHRHLPGPQSCSQATSDRWGPGFREKLNHYHYRQFCISRLCNEEKTHLILFFCYFLFVWGT